MSNAIFPTTRGLTWSVVWRSKWATLEFRSANKKRVAVALAQTAIYEIDLTWDYLKDDPTDTGGLTFTDLRTILGFFNARQGSFDNFLWQDPDDNQVTTARMIDPATNAPGIGNGAKTQFQLARNIGGTLEQVQNPNGVQSGAPVAQIFVNGVAKIAGTDYTINSTGLVTFTSALAANAIPTATFSFYHRVHFLDDTEELEHFMRNLWTLKKLTFETELL